jgi:hypothetical protein
VWDILTDLDKYVAWNPFIREAEGDIEEGAKLRIYIAPPDSKGMAFKPRVTRVVENSELRWQGKYIIPGLFDGEHIFELIPPIATGLHIRSISYIESSLSVI